MHYHVQKSRRDTLAWGTVIQSTPSHHNFPYSVIFLSSHSCTDLTSDLFLARFSTKLCIFLCSVPHFLHNFSRFFHLKSLITLDKDHRSSLLCSFLQFSLILSLTKLSCLSTGCQIASLNFLRQLNNEILWKPIFYNPWCRVAWQKCSDFWMNYSSTVKM
jgi:hypothetical protein